MNDHISHVLHTAKSKSDLHRVIDALPDNAQLILVANACCCDEIGHDPAVGAAVYHATYGNPTLSEAVGLLRLAEHRLITTILDGAE
jgi:hypothetical protein